jgi:lysozyme family protein
LAHQLGLIKEPFIQYELQELSKSIARSWFEQMVQEILEDIQKQNRSKEIQKYLQDEVLYDGAIDGYIGPRTQNAIKQLKLKRGCPIDAHSAECLELSTWLAR